jgi:hypothetical protein
MFVGVLAFSAFGCFLRASGAETSWEDANVLFTEQSVGNSLRVTAGEQLLNISGKDGAA